MGEHLKRLKELRMKKGIYQKEIADYLDITVASYSLYENGSREPNIYILKKLAKYYDVSLDYLIGIDNTDIDDNCRSRNVNDETREIALEIFENPDLRSLFDISRKMPPNHLKAYLEFIKKLYTQEKNEDT